MKKILLAALAASLAFVACNKEEASQPGEKAVAHFEITSGSSMTKAASAGGDQTTQSTEESKVQSLQILIFNGENREGYGKAANVTNLDVNCSTGSRKVYAVINGPDLSSVSTLTALKAVTSTLEEDADNFCMVGVKDVNVTNGGSYTVDVNRIAAKIVIKHINNKLTTGESFSVERIYITNVATTFNMGLDTYASATADFKNVGGYQAANNLGTFTQDLDLGATVANNASLTKDYYYYAYPNNYAQADYAATWVPKRTMLVVQIKIGTDKFDYPITMPALECNHVYVLDNLTITLPGNPDDGTEGGSDEEDPIVKSTASYTINVVDWTVVPVADVTI